MTANRNLKRRVRARAAKTGESYTAALRHVRPAQAGEPGPDTAGLRLAVAQTILHGDPRDAATLRDSGRELPATVGTHTEPDTTSCRVRADRSDRTRPGGRGPGPDRQPAGNLHQ